MTMFGRRRSYPCAGHHLPKRVRPGTTPTISGSIAGFMVVPHGGYDRGTTLAFGAGRTRPPYTPVGGGAGTTPKRAPARAPNFRTMPSAGAQPAQATRRLTLSLRIIANHTCAPAAPHNQPASPAATPHPATSRRGSFTVT